MAVAIRRDRRRRKPCAKDPNAATGRQGRKRDGDRRKAPKGGRHGSGTGQRTNGRWRARRHGRNGGGAEGERSPGRPRGGGTGRTPGSTHCLLRLAEATIKVRFRHEESLRMARRGSAGVGAFGHVAGWQPAPAQRWVLLTGRGRGRDR